ncbi:SDR family oxidoreductase [Streptomyces sp. NPDC020983]|uniref:SDR family oxidoreductase n=1 Tax=Streptomyces sp. NPDC020983 TaxID=3365106 RepID=UPI0037BC3F67
MKIAVAGGTGQAGRYAVEALRARGHDVVVMSRGAGVDLVTGAGLDAALAGAEALVDASNVTSARRKTVAAFFDAAGRHLADAAARAGVRHLVALSIVGIDRVKNPYYAGKLHQEEIVRRGAVPWTILRATQFHEFAGQTLAQLPGPLALMPKAPVQPVAARDVGEALADLVTGEPQGMAPELAGPQVESLVDMARRLMAAGGARKRPVLPVHMPGGMSSGGLLPTGPGPRGTLSFAAWLAEHHPATPA